MPIDMLRRFRRYFIGAHLDRTDDIFEKAKAITIIHFCWFFLLLYLIPITTDFMLGLHIALVKHVLDFFMLLALSFLIRSIKNLDLLINLFFGFSIFSLGLSFMILNPEEINLLSVAWSMLFLFLCALMQRGWMRIIFCFVICWLPLAYVFINSQLGGLLTVGFLQEKNVGERPVFLILIPAFIGIYALWNHTGTIRIAKKKILLQKETIEYKNQEMMDSIRYAMRIQTTLLASKSLLDKHLGDYFVLFKPKDIVSGDFYWATEKNGCFYLAVCDSTGHGVPGAFMSLLNISFMNEAISEKGMTSPDEVFNHTRQRLIENVAQEGSQDGMDGILLCFDRKNNTLTYAAANNHPVLVDHTVTELSKDKMHVGLSFRKEVFTNKTVKFTAGDNLYLYTDGFADQFGGPKGKKFKHRQLNALLQQIAHKPMEEQRETLDRTLESWKGELEQVDDILVIGIRLSNRAPLSN